MQKWFSQTFKCKSRIISTCVLNIPNCNVVKYDTYFENSPTECSISSDDVIAVREDLKHEGHHIDVSLYSDTQAQVFRRKHLLSNQHGKGNFKVCRRYSTGHHTRPPKQINYYEVLGVTPSCSRLKVKQAFYRLSKVYHPDINKTEIAVKKFQEISEAYEILRNNRTRELYDLERRSGHHGHVHKHSERRDIRHGQDKYKARGMPPMGRSNIYNFDEWYKEHYKETRERVMADKLKKEEYERFLHREERVHHVKEAKGFKSANEFKTMMVGTCLIVTLYLLFKGK